MIYYLYMVFSFGMSSNKLVNIFVKRIAAYRQNVQVYAVVLKPFLITKSKLCSKGTKQDYRHKGTNNLSLDKSL